MAHATVTDTILSHAPCSAVLSCTNLQRAHEFYVNKLGLTVTEKHDGAIRLQAGSGTTIMLYQRDQPPKAENTVAGFKVPDVPDAVKQLRAKGIVFEEYDLPGLKTVDGIAREGDMEVAWFKDPDGNILAVGRR